MEPSDTLPLFMPDPACCSCPDDDMICIEYDTRLFVNMSIVTVCNVSNVIDIFGDLQFAETEDGPLARTFLPMFLMSRKASFRFVSLKSKSTT